MENEKNEEEFYSQESIFDLIDADEINAAEGGFMLGYMGV